MLERPAAPPDPGTYALSTLDGSHGSSSHDAASPQRRPVALDADVEDALLGESRLDDEVDGDDGWAAERPPLKRDWLEEDGVFARTATRFPLLHSIASWRPDSRRARALLLLAAVSTMLLAVLSATAAAGYAPHLAEGLKSGEWRDTLSSAVAGVTSWSLWGDAGAEPWTRPMRAERDETVSFAEYLANISFVPFPVPAATAFVDANATSPLPHPSYPTTTDRNVVILTVCDVNYVHAVRVWALRARELGMPDDNVVILCMDEACLDAAEAHGLRAYGGFRKEVFEHKVPQVGLGQEPPNLPPLEAPSEEDADIPLDSEARASERRDSPPSAPHEHMKRGNERGFLFQYVKFRALYEINAAGFASLFFEADTALTKNPFDWMRPLVPDSYAAALEVAPEVLSVDERRRLPSPFALPRSSAIESAAEVRARSALVDPEGLDPGWDIQFTQDGWHLANFGWFLMRPTRATALFWRDTLRLYVARGGWDQEVVTNSIKGHGWTEKWIGPGWWEPGGALGENQTLPERPQKMEEKNQMEQWHFVDRLEGLKEGEHLRVAMLPLKKFFAYHFWGFDWWQPPEDTPDPIMHHMTAISYQMRNFWPKERGWYANVDGYHSPRPLLVPWNETYEHGLFPVKNYTSSDPAIPRTFYTRDEPDFYESTLTGTPDELLHYGRLLQLLGAVSVRDVEPLTASTGLEPVEVDNARVGDGDEARSSEKFAVKLPGRLRIDHNGKTIEQETTRFIDLDAVVRASVDIVEPAFFKHAARRLSASEHKAWTSTRLRVSLADFDSLPSLVTHLRNLLEPYFGSPSTGSQVRGIVVELSHWKSTLSWTLDALDANERARGLSLHDVDALRSTKRCQGWDRLVKLPLGWCNPE